MRILAIGDVVGQAGCDHVRSKLPNFKQKNQIDVVIANGENSAEGNGILPHSATHLFDSGVDVITGGNHVLKRREIYETLNLQQGVIRPANYHPSAPGAGYYVLDYLRYSLCVINLQGTVYMENLENPFEAIDRILTEIKTPNIIVDFHAEATAEKLCMGYYLDGRVSAVYGTHTHVQTADERILPHGTGYITDIGMCGGLHSVLGVKTNIAIEKMRTRLPIKFENEKEGIQLSGIMLEVDTQTGKCLSISRVLI